jgi:hypothetical protein
VTATLLDLKVNKEGLADSSRFFFSKSFHMQAGHIRWSSVNRHYNYRINNVVVKSSSRELEIGEFLVQPTMGEQAFVNSFPTQVERFDFAMQQVHVNGLDIDELLDRNLRAEDMSIKSVSLNIYCDLNRPPDHKNRVGLYPQQVMFHAPFQFRLRSITVPSAYIEYKEKSNITHEFTPVKFYATSAVFRNVSNEPAEVARNNIMTADIHTRLLNQLDFKTHWVFYLLNPQGKFAVSGTAGPIDATLLNPIIEPSGPARIESGYLNSGHFDLYGDNYNISGKAQMLYQDLKVTLMELDKGGARPDKKFLTSLLANILIKNDNPKRNQPVRTGLVNTQRNVNRSIFNLCWKGLLQGIKSSVGLNK